MKKIIFFTMLLLSFSAFALEVETIPTDGLLPDSIKPTKLWCIVYFKEKQNLKLILEAESIGAVDRKSEPFLTLKGKILDSDEFNDVNLYIVKASACTSDVELAKKTRDEKNKNAGQSPEKREAPQIPKSEENIAYQTLSKNPNPESLKNKKLDTLKKFDEIKSLNGVQLQKAPVNPGLLNWN